LFERVVFGVNMDHRKPPPSSEKATPIALLIRLSAVMRLTGLSRSTIYRMIAEHTFPAPVKLAKRAVAWRQDDVRRWSDQRPSTSAP
jgi:prophage regulatory protein